MKGFVLTNKAVSDLKSIGIYTQNRWGSRQRTLYLTTLDKAFHQLAANPLIGRDYGEMRKTYHKHQIGKHIIFFRKIDSSLIEIVRVLHERMDYELQLSET